MPVIDTNTNISNKIALLKKKKVSAVGRYYRTNQLSWRITRNEAIRLSAADIQIFTVFEDHGKASDLVLTKSQGRSDGKASLEQATTIGQPLGTAIYFAVEGLPNGYDTPDLPKIRNYFDGVKAAIGAKYKLGVYSDGVVCDDLLTTGRCQFAWLSASKAFPGTKAFYASGRWALAQKTPLDQDWEGLSVDLNEAKDDFGAFRVSP